MNRNLRLRRMYPLFCLLIMAAAWLCFAEPASASILPPSKVKDVQVGKISYDAVSLQWKESSRAESYEIYRASSRRGEYKKVGTSVKTGFTDKKLRTGSEYWYKVRAVDGEKTGFFSRKTSAVPRMLKPRLAASSTGDGPALKYTKVPGASGYIIYRDGKYLSRQKETAFTDLSAAAGKSHRYKVVAYREIGGTRVAASPVSNPARGSRKKLETDLNGIEEIPTLIQGDKFELTGKITSNATISRLEIGAADAETGEWIEECKYDSSDIKKKSFDISEADESVKISSLEPGKYKYMIRAEYLDGKSSTLLEKEFEVRETTEGGAAIVEAATECAWPYGTSKGKYKYSGGHRTDAYTAALKEAYGSRSSWSEQTRAGASCDVFVGTAVRVSGYDTGFPRGLDGIEDHISKNRDKWDILDAPDESELRPGDVVFQLYRGGGGHVMIYLGDGKVANAHYNGKTYGIVQTYSSQAHSKGGCSTFKVYRPIN